MDPSPNKLGLSLSGGGYRAAAFHLGTMKKLNELGVLQKVNVLSTISGGSITGACYCIQDEVYDDFEKKMKNLLSSKNVIKYILTSFAFLQLSLFLLIFIGSAIYVLFTPYAWLSPMIIALMILLIFLFQFKIFPVSKVIEKAYDSFFYKNATLSNLLDSKPLLAIGSTNLQTCRPFTFSKTKMEDSAYAFMKPPVYFKNAEFPLSKAVMASSCVPFAFTPISIDKEFFLDESYANEIKPVLVDGGVYDNQGIQKITQKGSSYECDIIITSDAGNKLPFQNSFNNVIILLIRTMDVFMARIKNFQMMQNLFRNTDFANKQISYISLGWDIENCIPGFITNLTAKQITQSVIDAHQLNKQWVNDPEKYRNELIDYLKSTTSYNTIDKPTLEEKKIARSVGTNLTALSMKQVDCLIKQAACLTELQVKLYCPSLI